MALLWTQSWQAAAAAETGIAIYDFAATGRWDMARVTTLVNDSTPLNFPGGQPRYRIKENHILKGFDIRMENGQVREGNLYQMLQDYSLREMLKRGYISKTLYDDVLYASHIWQPSQVRFAVDWIEMPPAEAERMYDGKIPWDRVIGDPLRDLLKDHEQWPDVPPERWKDLWPRDIPLRLVRASVMVGLGQETDLRTGKVRPLPLSWEVYPEAHPLAFRERGKLPLMAEFSRALSSDGVSGGSLIEPVRILLEQLVVEASLRGSTLEKYIIFAHSLDRARARYFRTAFKMRSFTDKTRDTLEAGAFDGHVGPDTPGLVSNRSVAFTTLADVTKLIPIEGISSDRHELDSLCWGPGTHRSVLRAFFQAIYVHLNFPNVPQQNNPVCIQNYSNLVQLPALDAFLAEGALNYERTGVDFDHDRDNAKFNGLMELLRHIDLDPNLYSPFWQGNSYIFFSEQGLNFQGQMPIGMVRIDNISEAAVRAHPGFLATVLKVTYGRMLRQMTSASKIAIQAFYSSMRVGIPQMHSSFPPHLRVQLPEHFDPVAILDHFIFAVTTQSPYVRDRLVEIGGISNDVPAYGLPELRGRLVNGELEIVSVGHAIVSPGYVVTLRPAHIRELPRPGAPTEFSCPTHLVDYFLQQAPARY